MAAKNERMTKVVIKVVIFFIGRSCLNVVSGWLILFEFQACLHLRLNLTPNAPGLRDIWETIETGFAALAGNQYPAKLFREPSRCFHVSSYL
jgi:Na+/H+ antiporter NhaB